MPKKHLLIVLLLLFATFAAFAFSPKQDSNSVHKGKLIGVSTVAATAYVGGLSGLYFLWYKDYDQSSFHFYNDNIAWLQVDKVGHAYSTYQMSRIAYTGFRWAGLEEKKATWISSAYGFAFFTSIEIMDGLSDNWGWSWGDVAANATGTALFLGQQLLWEEQRIQLKYSYYPSKYAAYNPDLLGSSLVEKMLKDYNAQTYWLSVNPQSFSTSRKIFPKWLNIAVGYGAKGMIGTYENPSEINGVAMPSFQRTRQFYLSLDLDLSKFKTRSEFWRLFLEVANMIKIPMPTIEYNKENGFEFYVIGF